MAGGDSFIFLYYIKIILYDFIDLVMSDFFSVMANEGIIFIRGDTAMPHPTENVRVGMTPSLP